MSYGFLDEFVGFNAGILQGLFPPPPQSLKSKGKAQTAIVAV
jgi:hypothetical protein